MCSASTPLAVSHTPNEEQRRTAAVASHKGYPPRVRRVGTQRERADGPHSAALQACRSLSTSADVGAGRDEGIMRGVPVHELILQTNILVIVLLNLTHSDSGNPGQNVLAHR
ncbi:hypothetical protein FB451DRAFT_1191621 [Mycena latifolia]|nr:hypothetical protein FB451DRAFT_1191621 [Mycena latifolia]